MALYCFELKFILHKLKQTNVSCDNKLSICLMTKWLRGIPTINGNFTSEDFTWNICETCQFLNFLVNNEI